MSAGQGAPGPTEGTYRLPDTLAGDIEKLRQMIEEARAGALAPERLRAFRVPMGVYEQRESGTFMLRIRVPAGGVLPHQMRALAETSERFGDGVLHVTTRQDIQVHGVPLESIHPALVALHAAGLSTKGGGGNTVRNITACPHAGVCPDEAFDVTPWAIAVTEFLLADPLSCQLPRKYKIAFAGCGRDCPGATVNDLGFIAKRRDGADGFAVYAGGGMGAWSRVADRLEEFVPAADAPLVAEAVKRVFDQHGNRKNRHQARLRFLVERIGLDAFRDLYAKELAELRKGTGVPLPAAVDALGRGANGQEETKKTPVPFFHSVSPQKQQGYNLVEILLPLGDISADALRGLADVVARHGDGMLRTTQQQNAVLRWVPDGELAGLHGELAALGLADARPAVLRHLTACTGAATCRLGICLARGLATAVDDALSRDVLDLARLGDLRVHINGCPNACGRHPIAQIGLFGAARRVGGRLVPHYVVQLGGRLEEGRTRLAEGKAIVPARHVPAFLRDFLAAFAASPHCPDFDGFLDNGGRALADEMALKHGEVPDFAEDKNPYFDWGSDELFSLAGRGPGECSAGVFDLIEVDLASAREAVEQGRGYRAVALAARALLVTRGEEPGGDLDAIRLFLRHFLEQGLVDGRFATLLEQALPIASGAEPEGSFQADRGEVSAFVEAVQALYGSMDASLRVPAPAADTPPGTVRDFRGVACPLNYVKTKLALEGMEAGDTLLVLLGEEGARKVPASAEADGHQVLAKTREGDQWRVLIRKGKEAPR